MFSEWARLAFKLIQLRRLQELDPKEGHLVEGNAEVSSEEGHEQ